MNLILTFFVIIVKILFFPSLCTLNGAASEGEGTRMTWVPLLSFALPLPAVLIL